MKKQFLFLCLCILLSSCIVSAAIIYSQFDKAKQENVISQFDKAKQENVISENIIKKDNNIKFEVQNFELSYEDNSRNISDYKFRNEKYFGNGIIVASGDAELVSKPYVVIIKFIRKSGGNGKNTNTEYIKYLPIINGTGKIITEDTVTDGNDTFDKPVYEFTIIGYLPITEQIIQK